MCSWYISIYIIMYYLAHRVLPGVFKGGENNSVGGLSNFLHVSRVPYFQFPVGHFQFQCPLTVP
jgi:hypothetical protein